jgi:hypothetical protein
MVLSGKAFEATAIILSFTVSCVSYALIAWKDKSWINWATPAFFLSLGGHYLFQFAYLCLNRPAGSHYAYAFCYTTYALTSLISALVYAFIKPFKIKVHSISGHYPALWPGVFLFVGFLLYLPILIPFRAYLTQPRHIYELTRNGYGVWFYGSTFFTNLALIAFLFTRRKIPLMGILFSAVIVLLTFWHGSKGLFLDCVLIWVLFRVYVQRKAIRAGLALCLAGALGCLVIGSFFLFSSPDNIVELFTSVTSYADYVRNAMIVIDDEHGKRYYGRILLEEFVYSRTPRALMPDKPKDFGAFQLAKNYNPANYRAAEGTGAYDVGVQYADFGPLALVYLCVVSSITAWFASAAVAYLKRTPSIGVFIVLLFLSDVSVFPVIIPFFLVETLLLGAALLFLARVRILKSPVHLRPSELSAGNVGICLND